MSPDDLGSGAAPTMPPGWYLSPYEANSTAFWNGATWERSTPLARLHRPPRSIGGILALGGLAAFVAIVLFSFAVDSTTADADVSTFVFWGSVAATIGYTLITVAVVAFGVLLGNRHTDWDRELRTSSWQ